MQREKSCGAVVYRRTGAGALFLLERMVQGHTSIPKGHVEAGETEEETARREIREETGLEVELNMAFRRTISYSPRPGVMKDVVFFLAEALPGETVNQECEVSAITWLPFEEALAALTHASDREVLTAANAWLMREDSGEAAIRLEEVTPKNWQADLHVREDQQRYVASREGTLARAFAYRNYRSRAFVIMNGEEPVGMAMYHDAPRRNAYCFSEFFIDERHQGQGLGRAAAQLVLGQMRAEGAWPKAFLICVEGNDPAKSLYESLGFRLTGEADGDGIFMELALAGAFGIEDEAPVDIRETPLTEDALAALLRFSADWEAEGSCHGYRANTREDIEGRRIFVAEVGGEVVGYLFGKMSAAKEASSVMAEGTPCFEVEELYVVPERRSQGIGKRLFAFAEDAVREDAEFITLSTATKNHRAILHFYVDEVGMEFWNARLFKKRGN